MYSQIVVLLGFFRMSVCEGESRSGQFKGKPSEFEFHLCHILDV